MRVRVCALNLWTDIYIYIYIPEERSSKCLIRTTESTPISHEDVNQWVTILQTEVTTSRIPLQPISRSESPRDGTLGITRHWIQNDTNVGDKIDQPNQLKLCQIFKWCQTVEPFFVRKWLKDSHSLGWKASIYIYTHIFMFRQQKPSSVGWHSIEWWQVMTWLAFIVGSCHNEWTAP